MSIADAWGEKNASFVLGSPPAWTVAADTLFVRSVIGPDGERVKRAAAYDLGKRRWRELPESGLDLCSDASAVARAGGVFVWGGRARRDNSESEYLASLVNLSTGKWNAMPMHPCDVPKRLLMVR